MATLLPRFGRRFGLAALLGVCASAAGFGACGGPAKLPPPQEGTTGQGAGGGGAGGSDILPSDDAGPPPLDAQGLCGNQVHQIITEAPNVYFVIDASGSMGSAVSGGTRSTVVRKAAVDLVRNLGALINIGAALFPVDATSADQCATGAEVMPVMPGDPYSGSNLDGPTTNKFKHAIAVDPAGGTPLSATLVKLEPSLAALPGKTVVLLVTDGGPNCNAGASCDASGCEANINGCTGDACCNPGGNCCAPQGAAGPEGCVDRQAAVDALKAYAAASLPVYVIGIPGSEAYSSVLEQMAFAAGTAQPGKPFYYAVGALDNLGSVLGDIAAVAISCVFTLEDPPQDAGQTNVYLDGVVLPADLNNGWRFMDPDLTRIELLGDACKDLKSGQIKSVQIVSGCPTEPAK